MTDIQKMHGKFSPPEIEGETAVICGSAPVITMQGYQTDLVSYTKGRGRMSCTLKGYEECHNTEEVVEVRGYDPEADLDNPSGSVFCAHGAGFVVGWEQAHEYMHIQTGWKAERDPDGAEEEQRSVPYPEYRTREKTDEVIDDKELEEIFARTYGAPSRERKLGTGRRRVQAVRREPQYSAEKGAGPR